MTIRRLAIVPRLLLPYLLAMFPQATAQNPQSVAQDPPPLPRGPIPGSFCEPSGPLLHIPSRTAGTEGLLVRLSPPAKPRYPQGAPIAVHINPFPMVNVAFACLSEQGFIDVNFLCPGREYRQPDGTVWKSGGAVDRRQVLGLDCVEPLADVLSFATGRTRSLEGKAIQDYLGGVRAITGNVGVVGWSFGGNLAVLAMARHGERFPALKWYASWESPFLGGGDNGWPTIFEANPFFNPATNEVDFKRLRYSPEMPIWVWPPAGSMAPPGLGVRSRPDWPHGGLYLDGDDNGAFDRNADYGFWAIVDPGPPLKAFYTPKVTREARDRKVFGDNWPPHIATLDETEERESHVDALRHLPEAVRKFPRLAVLVFQSQQSHVNLTATHPHAIAQVNGWMDTRASWVRFNPDVHYVEWAMGRKPSREIQCPAGQKINREVIRDLVEPKAKDGGPTDAEGMTAAVCELADRTYRHNWAPVVTGVLVQEKVANR